MELTLQFPKATFRNYIHPTALQRLVPGSVITFTDFDHAKTFAKNYPDSGIRGQLEEVRLLNVIIAI